MQREEYDIPFVEIVGCYSVDVITSSDGEVDGDWGEWD